MEHGDITYNDITFTTVKSGRWSDPTVWGGNIPTSHAAIIVKPKHTLTLDLNVVICDLIVEPGATFTFDRKKSLVLNNCGHIINEGRFIMKPLISSVTHTIKFRHIDETKMIGGGMGFTKEDIGFWAFGSGIIDIAGSPKTSWTNLSSFANAGDIQIKLSSTPYGWNIGDEIVITPTNSKSTEFDIRKIVKIEDVKITLDNPLSHDHPQIINKRIFTSEVLNLTRNVRIEGEGDGTANPSTNGRAHINIAMIKQKFNLSNVQIRHMGPRRMLNSFTEKILGRYPLHLHHCMNATQGSIIDGVVVRDCGSHAFVPHASHGIIFRNCISFNTFEDAYWWDIPSDNGTSPINNSNDITYDGCIAVLTKADPPYRGYRLASFLLGSGLRNTIKNCIAVGNQGNTGSAGFLWPESSNYTDNLWEFDNNISHNNKTNGIFVWQNDPHNHQIKNFAGYNNGENGIEHGAYSNAYKYSDILLMGNKYGILLHSNPRPKGTKDQDGYIVSFRNISSLDPLYITRHTLIGEGPTLFKDCDFSQVIVNELPSRNIAYPPPGLFDFVNCTGDFILEGMEKNSLIRVQNPDKTAYQITDDFSIKEISQFFKIN